MICPPFNCRYCGVILGHTEDCPMVEIGWLKHKLKMTTDKLKEINKILKQKR